MSCESVLTSKLSNIFHLFVAILPPTAREISMRKLSGVILVLTLAFFTKGVWAGGPSETASLVQVPWNVVEHRMSNGMRALLIPDRRAPAIVFMVWYKAGSRDEQPGKTGLAHILEHMMFRGTSKYGPKEFSNIVQRNGGSHNAFTSFDYTAYFERIASDRLELVMELEADRMVNLVLKEEEFNPERDVVLEERRSRTEDRPTGKVFETLNAKAFRYHTYGNPIIGWENDILHYTVEDLRAFYKKYYAPNNATVIIVGDFQVDGAIRLLEKHFGAIPPRPIELPEVLPEPIQTEERRLTIRKEAQLPYISLAHHVPNWKHEDAPALLMLEFLLGGGETSRLHQRLVRKDALTLSVGVDYTSIAREPRLFYIFAQVAPGKKTDLIEKVIEEEINLLIEKGIPEKELRLSIRGLEARTVFAMDSHFFRAMLLGRAHIAGDWRQLERYLPDIAEVTTDDVIRVAKKYLKRKNRTTAILVPIPPSDGKTPPSARGPAGEISEQRRK